MSLNTTILLSTEKHILDVNDKWLKHGNYSFNIKNYSSNNTIIGTIHKEETNESYEFKFFTIIKLMAKAQSRLARRMNVPIDITEYPSPSNSPAECPPGFSSQQAAHHISPTNYIQCTICLEKCANKLACGHYFHKKCIANWEQQSNTCPVCRIEI
jgi:hypothetical protein